MESDYGVQLPRNLLIEFSQIVQQLSDSSGKEVTSPMLWETFRAEYFTDASGPLSAKSKDSSSNEW